MAFKTVSPNSVNFVAPQVWPAPTVVVSDATAGAPLAKDKTKPTVPTNVVATIVSTTQVNLTWDASTDPVVAGQETSGVKQYRVFRNSQKIATTDKSVRAYTATGLTPGNTYQWRIAAVDRANNQSGQSPQVTTIMPSAPPVPNDPDTTAPTVPLNLLATTQGETQINLTWSASTDPTVAGQEHSGLAGYKIYREGAFVASVLLVTSYQDTGLTPATEYSYRVSAVDVDGNESAQSVASVATTTSPGLNPDITPPSVPASLAATVTSTSTISLTWAAATDPEIGGEETSGLAGYKLRRGGTLIATLGLVTTYGDSGLAAATQYTYTLASIDVAGNESAQSGAVSATTNAASPGSPLTAASALLADVQAAVNNANDGDTVLIPNGTVAWSGGINTSKQIRIRAQNYTPTPAGLAGTGASTRNVTITNNSASSLFTFNTGNSYHVGLAGIRFNEGSGNGAHVTFNGTGSKVPLLNDCYFQNKSRNWPAEQAITIHCRGGVMWNCVMVGTQDIHQVGEGSLLVKYPNGVRDWTTASTMGMLDANGNWNFYVEDTTFTNVGACPDCDDHGRIVFRHCIYDGTWGATHGFTSSWGGRHWEYYDNHFKSRTPERNISNRYFWCRAGTGVFTGNIVDEDFNPSDYGGQPVQLNIGDNTSPGTYLMPRQPGCGHNGTSYVSDPIYIWAQTGQLPYGWSYQGQPGGWQNIVQEGRDIFVNAGAKPGYTRYTYPHPLRS